MSPTSLSDSSGPRAAHPARPAVRTGLRAAGAPTSTPTPPPDLRAERLGAARLRAPDAAVLLLKRFTLRWQPPAMEAKGAMIYAFMGGVGYANQPKTDGFRLNIDDLSPLNFDVVREASHWKSADGKVELLYLPTWTSALDSSGYFFLITPKPAKAVTVTSMGTGSLRWFAIDKEQSLSKRLRQLTRALNP